MNGHCLDVPALGGRTLCASKPLSLGDLILREAPELYLDKNAACREGAERVEVICKVYLRNGLEDLQSDVSAMVLSYMDRSDFQNHDLSDYYTPSDDSDEPAVIGIDKVLKEVCKFYKELDRQRFRQFVFAMLSNAHSYGNEVLLYPYTSKMAHSCFPNVIVVVDPVTRECSTFATRSIAQNEPLCFSYLTELPISPSSILFTSVNARRAHLRRTKYFVCQCERCKTEIERPISMDLCEAYHSWLAENRVGLMANLKNNSDDSVSTIERCLLDLGLALKNLSAIPGRFGWGVCVSENLASEGALRLLAATKAAEDEPLCLSITMGTLRPGFLEISRSLDKLPNNVGFALKDEFLATLRDATRRYRSLCTRYSFVLDDNEPLSNYLVQ